MMEWALLINFFIKIYHNGWSFSNMCFLIGWRVHYQCQKFKKVTYFLSFYNRCALWVLSKVYIQLFISIYSYLYHNAHLSKSCCYDVHREHYSNDIMGAMASQIIKFTVVYTTIYSGADQRKHQSSASLAFMWRIHRWPMSSPHKGPVIQKIIMKYDNDIIACLIKLNTNQLDQSMMQQNYTHLLVV